jgi:hypothetical protein
MIHHPHVHMIVSGGGISLGISLDGSRRISCRPGFLGPVRVLSRLFRRLFPAGLADADAAGRLAFFGDLDGLRDRRACAAHRAPLRRKNWVLDAKPPFAGPEAVLACLARHTHRVAIANSRLLALDARGVTFRCKDYRRNGPARHRTMTLAPDEFIRRFLLPVLPRRCHRIRHYGVLASPTGNANIARANIARANIACQGAARRAAAARSAGQEQQHRSGRQCRDRPSPALPLLRRPHDHRRELRARRGTASSAVATSRGRDRDTMMTRTASLRRPLAGGCRFGCRSPVAARP